MATSEAPPLPAHVDPARVYPFDIYFDARLREDPHLGWHSLQGEAPDIFWTPENEGHWIVLRYDDQFAILRDTEHFSNRELDIPKSNSPNLMIPLNLDPPEHTRYRAVLMKAFGGGAVKRLEPKLRDWARQLIDAVLAEGRCDFTERLGAGFPVSVFMELMGMPHERFEEFRAIVLEYFGRTTVERRIELQNTMIAILDGLYAERREHPREDLMTDLIEAEVRGQKLTDTELQSIGFLLFLAGLDTVANALTFAFRHLALDAALQQRLRDDPGRLADFVEESLRRFAVVNQTRLVKKDVEIGGVRFREGDMVLCPLTTAGMDERRNPEPEHFDLDRADREHITFSTGPHTCIGNLLARAEMRIFTEEWLARVERFELDEEGDPAWRPGLVMGLTSLPIRWTART